MLEKIGYNVIACTHSREALDKFEAQPGEFDLVITDQSMPNLSGIQLGKRMKKIRPDVPIILSTGYSDIFDFKLAQAAGIEGYLSKPYSIQKMSETVRSTLDKNRSNT